MGRTKSQSELKSYILVSCVQIHRSGAAHSTGRVKGCFRMKGGINLSGKEGQREENGHGVSGKQQIANWKICSVNTDRK